MSDLIPDLAEFPPSALPLGRALADYVIAHAGTGEKAFRHMVAMCLQFAARSKDAGTQSLVYSVASGLAENFQGSIHVESLGRLAQIARAAGIDIPKSNKAENLAQSIAGYLALAERDPRYAAAALRAASNVAVAKAFIQARETFSRN